MASFSHASFLFVGDFYTYSQHLSTTIAGEPKSLVDYLVKSLGFSKQEAIATSLKVSSLKSTRNPNSVVDFFKETGFNDTHIKKLVSGYPDILRSDVEKTLKPKFKILQGLGLSGSDLGDLFATKRGYFIIRNFGTENVTAAVDFLTSICGTNENVVKILKKLHWRFSIENATRNVTLLQNYGVSSERIQKAFVQYPRLPGYSPDKFEEVCARIVEKFGISVESPAFLTIIVVLASNTAENLNLKYQAFKSYGWTESDIGNIMRRQPICLKLSEVTIRRKLEFLMKNLGLEAGYITTRTSLLTCSLEKRVVPRNAVLQVLKERKLIRASVTLYRVLSISESKFLSNFVVPYKDELPGLFEAYSNNNMDSFIKNRLPGLTLK